MLLFPPCLTQLMWIQAPAYDIYHDLINILNKLYVCYEHCVEELVFLKRLLLSDYPSALVLVKVYPSKPAFFIMFTEFKMSFNI